MAMKKYSPKFGFALVPAFLLGFVLFIFGPVEIFFSNVNQFEFLFGEFILWMILVGLGVTVILGALIALLPGRAYGIGLAAILGISLSGYIQVMFLNQNLDLMGLNPNGATINPAHAALSIAVWLVIIALSVMIYLKWDKLFRKAVIFICVLLVGMQAVAFASLIAGADEGAFKRPQGDWYLSGKEQMAISSKDNVIIILLDYFSNQYVEPIEAKYPGAFDFLHDFTYYDNDECVYHGTYPSIAHMITAQELDMNMPTHDWTRSIWENEQTRGFYSDLKKQGFVFNLFTPESSYVRGDNDIRILEGMIDNLSNDAGEMLVDTPALVKLLSKMSAYRFLPDVLKNTVAINNSEITSVVKMANNSRAHENSDFYSRLLDEGLHIEKGPGIVSFQHLVGAHEYTVDEHCQKVASSTMEETGKGCLVMLEEYLNQLKALGKYDDSTIIITSDHGGERDPQVIFFYKKPGETHDASPVNHAPISHCEFLPTVAAAAGIDYSYLGATVEDIPDEPRDRLYMLHTIDSAYPSVRSYAEDKEAPNNVYYIYLYQGDYSDLYKKIETGPDAINPMVDSFF